ncbi:hypothetical protein [Bradyrhizobium sp. 150]|uniref:hypothetical protein n=1 Tax=Bradyrhizobium sp. 150 TaxID=2782625 RepID=UPI001FFAEBED|nr:hypothetical protein [Bradyrhizobium sp. 150]MCK1670350.1 hypothetical protein [Bradyrhizobium sp. 150]
MKEKIALCTEFRPEERDLILDAVNDYIEDRDVDEHSYPSKYPPGSDPWVTAAWEILDTLKVGALKSNTRAWLAGMIAGALSNAFEMGGASAEAARAIKQ